MTGLLITLLIGGVLLSAVGQVLIKIAMSDATMQSAIGSSWGALILTGITSPWLLCGLLAYAVSVLLWLAVLARLDLSFAYPFVALGIVVTTIAGRLLLGEELPVMRVVALAVIVAGIVLLAATYPRPQ